MQNAKYALEMSCSKAVIVLHYRKLFFKPTVIEVGFWWDITQIDDAPERIGATTHAANAHAMSESCCSIFIGRSRR
jgi:hypothetical protein